MEAGGVEGVDEVVRAGQGVEAVVQLVGVEDAEVQDFVVFEHRPEGVQVAAEGAVGSLPAARIVDARTVAVVEVELRAVPAQGMLEEGGRTPEAATDVERPGGLWHEAEDGRRGVELAPAGAVLGKFPEVPGRLAGLKVELGRQAGDRRHQLRSHRWRAEVSFPVPKAGLDIGGGKLAPDALAPLGAQPREEVGEVHRHFPGEVGAGAGHRACDRFGGSSAGPGRGRVA